MISDNKPYLTSIAISFAVAISCVAICLRLLARKVQRLPFLADGYTIIAGAVSQKSTGVDQHQGADN